jgi:hypothetical protein
MPRYYFHLRSKDQLTWDQVGVDLPDPTTAKAQQISLLQNSVAASCMKARMGAVGLLRSPMKVMKSSISRHFRRGAYVQERRHYQPNAAIFERRSIPPAFVRRISRPIAKRNTAGSCKAGGIRAHKVLVT